MIAVKQTETETEGRRESSDDFKVDRDRGKRVTKRKKLWQSSKKLEQ